MKDQRGRPVLGAIAGLFFGLFLSIDLVLLGAQPLDSNLLVVFPLLGFAAGIALAFTAPALRRRSGDGQPRRARLRSRLHKPDANTA